MYKLLAGPGYCELQTGGEIRCCLEFLKEQEEA